MNRETTIAVAEPTEAHYDGWCELYRGYADFYQVPMTTATLETVWSWLQDATHPTCGLLAMHYEQPIGLAHYRDMPSPLRGATVGFLDDLFVSPMHRGSGAVDALLNELTSIGRTRGWPLMRWITRDNNYRARAFYDRNATRTDWITYQLDT